KWLERLAPDRCGRRLASRQIPLGGTPKQRTGAGRSTYLLDLRPSAVAFSDSGYFATEACLLGLSRAFLPIALSA
ncbi:MAG: hypothetical protein WCL19_10920, partial [Verrucomicrobiota bacterium]